MTRQIQILHRAIGMVALVVVVFLATTGMLINHSEDLELYAKYPESPLVLKLYGYDDSKASASYIEEPPSWERVLTAFHGGRFFGNGGNLILDLVGFICIMLAASGTWLMVKGGTNRKDERQVKCNSHSD